MSYPDYKDMFGKKKIDQSSVSRQAFFAYMCVEKRMIKELHISSCRVMSYFGAYLYYTSIFLQDILVADYPENGFYIILHMRTSS